MKWFFRLMRWHRNVKAIVRGKISQRIWNRAVTHVARKFYRRK